MSAKKDKEKKDQEAQEREDVTQPQEAAEEEPAEETQDEVREEISGEISEADALKAQLDGLSDKLMRTLAEYDNYRKRSQRERMEVYPQAVADTVSKFLPVLDNIERALGAECADPEFKKGVDMVHTSFLDCFKTLNVEEIDAQGKEFDPNLHNAVMHIESEELGENTIAMVLQKGYRIRDKVLRHAMVQVAN